MKPGERRVKTFMPHVMNCVAIVKIAKKINLFFGAFLNICISSIIGTPKIIHSQSKATVKASIITIPIIPTQQEELTGKWRFYVVFM